MKVSCWLGCNTVSGKRMQCAGPDTHVLFVWNTKHEKACKSLTGYLESLIIIFFTPRNSVFPPSGSSSLSVWHQLWEEEVGTIRGTRINQERKYKVSWAVLPESVGHGHVGGDGPYWLGAFSGPPHNDSTWQSRNPSLTYFLPNPPQTKQMEKCSDTDPHMMSQSWRGTCRAFCLHRVAQAVQFCMFLKHPFLFEIFALLSLLTFQFRLSRHEEIIQRRVARNAWHVCIQSDFTPDPSD